MTATVNETAPETAENPKETETPKESAEQILSRLKVDDTDELLFAKTEKAIKEYNSVVSQLKELSGDLSEVTDTVRNSDDPEIVALRDAVEKAQATLKARQDRLDSVAKEKAEAKISTSTDKEKVDTLTAQSEKLLKRIKATQTALVTDYGDEIRTAFTDLVTKRGGSNATGRGAGVARPRNFTIKVNGEVATLPNNSGEKVSSFSAAAKVIGCKTADLQAKYFESEGSDAEKWIPGKVVTFTVTQDGKTYSVEAVKNRDAK